MRVEHDGDYAVVASLGGAPSNPVWYHNLKADPHVELQDGADQARLPRPRGDRRREGRLVGAGGRGVARLRRYQTKTTRQIPVFVLEPIEAGDPS